MVSSLTRISQHHRSTCHQNQLSVSVNVTLPRAAQWWESYPGEQKTTTSGTSIPDFWRGIVYTLRQHLLEFMLLRKDHLNRWCVCGTLPNIQIAFSRIHFLCTYEFMPPRFWQRQYFSGGNRWQNRLIIMKSATPITMNIHFLLISGIICLWIQISLENLLKTVHTWFLAP